MELLESLSSVVFEDQKADILRARAATLKVDSTSFNFLDLSLIYVRIYSRSDFRVKDVFVGLVDLEHSDTAKQLTHLKRKLQDVGLEDWAKRCLTGVATDAASVMRKFNRLLAAWLGRTLNVDFFEVQSIY